MFVINWRRVIIFLVVGEGGSIALQYIFSVHIKLQHRYALLIIDDCRD